MKSMRRGSLSWRRWRKRWLGDEQGRGNRWEEEAMFCPFSILGFIKLVADSEDRVWTQPGSGRYNICVFFLVFSFLFVLYYLYPGPYSNQQAHLKFNILPNILFPPFCLNLFSLNFINYSVLLISLFFILSFIFS